MNKTISISQFQINSAMIFIMISIVITFISFLTAERVYSEYTLIPYSVIFVSTFVGLEVMLYLCVVPLSELVDCWDKKRKGLNATNNFVVSLPIDITTKVETPSVSKEADATMAKEPEVINDAISVTTKIPETEKTAALIEPQVTSKEVVQEEKPVDADIQAIYNRSEAENREMDAKIKEKKAALIKYYITDTMAPLLEKEDMEVFLIEFEQWINHSAYHPKGRNWKWKKDVNIKVSDVRHLVWNIAKRLGMEKGYNTETCAEFIKNMFPDICQEVKKSTLSQTLTADPDKGYIKLDRPDDKDSFRFHN